MTSAVRIIGIDPGFANLGISLIEMDHNERLYLLEGEVVSTKKATSKARIRACDDLARRGSEITDVLNRFMSVDGVIAVACEGLLGSGAIGGAHSRMLMGYGWGLVQGAAAARSLPLLQTGPKAVKKALCGNVSASKTDVASAACRRVTGLEGALEGLTKSKREHLADAAAAAIVCLNYDEVRIFVRQALRLMGGAA